MAWEEMDLAVEPAGPKCCHHWIIQPAEGLVSEGICYNCQEVRTFANFLERHDWLSNESQSPNAPTRSAGERERPMTGPTGWV